MSWHRGQVFRQSSGRIRPWRRLIRDDGGQGELRRSLILALVIPVIAPAWVVREESKLSDSIPAVFSSASWSPNAGDEDLESESTRTLGNGRTLEEGHDGEGERGASMALRIEAAHDAPLLLASVS
ncbi:hypothetical protein BD414DRAFT_472380, partial [Trametes punicea]